jgi:hypothetical protein
MCEHRPQAQGKDRSKVQEARGGGMKRLKQTGAKTEEGKYLFGPFGH